MNPGTTSSRTELLVFVRRPSTHIGQSNWGVVQLVRASVLYTGSRGFKSRRPNNYYICNMGARNYKREYKKYGKGGKAKKYRAALNRIARRLGVYGNGDGLDNAHVGSSDRTTPQPQSVNRANNRPRRRRSR